MGSRKGRELRQIGARVASRVRTGGCKTVVYWNVGWCATGPNGREANVVSVWIVRVRFFSLRHDVGRIAEALGAWPDCRLVVIDPVSAFLDGGDHAAGPRSACPPEAAVCGAAAGEGATGAGRGGREVVLEAAGDVCVSGVDVWLRGGKS